MIYEPSFKATALLLLAMILALVASQMHANHRHASNEERFRQCAVSAGAELCGRADSDSHK